MSDVFVYDSALAPINLNLIQIVENDSRGVQIDKQTNTLQPGGEYGARMNQPNPLVPVGFWIDDTSGKYAPTGLEFFNPSHSLQVPVTLFPLPSGVAVGGGGGGGGDDGGSPPSGGTGDNDLTLRQGGRWRFGRRGETREFPFIDAFNNLEKLAGVFGWTEEQMHGVATLIATIAKARMLSAPDEDFRERIRRWETQLRRLGVMDKDYYGSGGTQGGPSKPIEFPHPGVIGDYMKYRDDTRDRAW